MPKFTLICDHSCDLDTDIRSHTFRAEYLPEVLVHIEEFLKGAGYCFDGALDIVNYDEEWVAQPECDPCDNAGCPCNHSKHYYDTERNK